MTRPSSPALSPALRLLRALRRAHAFTLLELLVVILVVAVLIAVAAPAFLGHQDKAHDSVAKQYLAYSYKNAKLAAVENDNQFPVDEDLDDAEALVDYIQENEPELAVTEGFDCRDTDGMGPDFIVVDKDDSQPDQYIAYSRSASGRIWRIVQAEDNAAHQIDEACVRGPENAPINTDPPVVDDPDGDGCGVQSVDVGTYDRNVTIHVYWYDKDGNLIAAATDQNPYTPDPADCPVTPVLEVVYDPDTTPDGDAPDTFIDYGPASSTSSRTAEIGFHASEPSTFECRLDGGDWLDCSNPALYYDLAPGSHTFEVRAIDLAGNVDPTPATWTWTVTSGDPPPPPPGSPPDTYIDSGPGNPTTSTTANFTFHASEPSTFQCQLDGGSWASCATPKSYTVSVGSHVFRVRAVANDDSQVDPTPAEWSWTVETETAPPPPPPPTIYYPLYVSKKGSGTGTVTSSPSGVDCGADCREDYGRYTQVTLTAAPASGSTFLGWSGDCFGDATTCQVTMDRAKSVQAIFEASAPAGKQHLITSVAGQGLGKITTSTPTTPKVVCTSTCWKQYATGTLVTLTVTPADGSKFVGWTGACEAAGTNKTCQVTMNSLKRVRAQLHWTKNPKYVPSKCEVQPENNCTRVKPNNRSLQSSSNAPWLMWSGNADGGEDVFAAKADGSGLWNVTGEDTDRGGDNPSIPPSNALVQFNSARDDGNGNTDYSVWQIPQGGGPDDATKVSGAPIPEGEPASWSQNGKSAYRTFSNIVVDGATVAASTPVASEEEVAISPDGTKVAFEDFTTNLDIKVVNSDGTNLVNATASSAAADVDPAWAPASDRIVFASNRDGDYDLYAMDPDGTNVEQLTNAAGSDRSPAYSPDGTAIVFASNRDGAFKLYTMDADGSGEALLAGSSDVSNVSFSPDGTKIAFESGGQIWTVDPDGTGLTQVSAGGTNEDYVWGGWADPGSSGGPTPASCGGGPTSTDNNDFALAREMTGATGTYIGNNSTATKETGEPDGYGNGGTHTIWYCWVAPSSGPMAFDAFGNTNESPQIAVYTGSAVNALTMIGADYFSSNNTGERYDVNANITWGGLVEFTATAGETYWIQVMEGWGGDTEMIGNIEVGWGRYSVKVSGSFSNGHVTSTPSGINWGSDDANDQYNAQANVFGGSVTLTADPNNRDYQHGAGPSYFLEWRDSVTGLPLSECPQPGLTTSTVTCTLSLSKSYRIAVIFVLEDDILTPAGNYNCAGTGGAPGVTRLACGPIGRTVQASGLYAFKSGSLIYTLSGSSITSLGSLTSGAIESTLSLNPSGSKLAFSTGSNVYTMNVDGTNRVRIGTDINGVSGASIGKPRTAWSPDGSLVAFTGYQQSTNVCRFGTTNTNHGCVWVASSSGGTTGVKISHNNSNQLPSDFVDTFEATGSQRVSVQEHFGSLVLYPSSGCYYAGSCPSGSLTVTNTGLTGHQPRLRPQTADLALITASADPCTTGVSRGVFKVWFPSSYCQNLIDTSSLGSQGPSNLTWNSTGTAVAFYVIDGSNNARLYTACVNGSGTSSTASSLTDRSGSIDLNALPEITPSADGGFLFTASADSKPGLLKASPGC